MNVIITTVYTEEDKNLLSKEIPDNPCDVCDPYMESCCTGCLKKHIYNDVVKPYKDNDIYGLALLIKERNRLKRSINDANDRIAQINSQLPDFVNESEVDKSCGLLSVEGCTK